MSSIKKLTQKRLFLPIFSMILVMLINVVYDIATGSAPLGFFMISIKNGVLYGRLIDILNRGSEIAILAIGMTLVVSASGGTDISVGSVMSLYAGVCCMILAGYGNVNVQQYAHPLLVGIGAGLLVTLICGMFNGFLVAYMNIQPMVATLILWSAGRAVGLLLCNSQIVYVRVPSFQKLGGYCGIIPTPIIVAAVCVAIASIVLRYTALGTYIPVSYTHLICQNDNEAYGAMDAMDAAGITYGVDGDVTLISFDATHDGLQYTLDGKINCDVECNPIQAEIGRAHV